MRLEFENGLTIEDPDDALIAEALATLGIEGELPEGGILAEDTKPFAGKTNEYAILGRDDMTYIQASGHPDTGFILEYQEDTLEEHFCSIDKTLSLEQIISAFQKFACGDASYKNDLAWARDETGGGCLGTVVFLIIGAGAAGAALWQLL
ncbi:MAG: hypothetical protein HQ592_02785 [Planctomycetes bacterium]|nr:hypothetical protein [Planctomycetota bacterium]